MAGVRRASRRRSVLLVVVLTAVTLITLDTRNGRSGPIGALGRAAHTVVSPLQGAVNNVAGPVGDWWNGVTDSGNLKKQNRNLENQVAALQGQQRDAQAALQENRVLRQFLELRSTLDVKNVTGLIIDRDPGNFDPTLTIDKGTESGIAVDMPAIAPAGLVGKVIEAWHGGSKIQVLTDPSFAVTIVAPPHGSSPSTQGVASGQVGSHQLEVDFDPGSVVAAGDRIVTSPASQLFPPEIPVGTITKAAEQPGGIGVAAQIKPYVDLGGLQYVTVLEWVQGDPPAFKTTTTTSTTTTTPTTVANVFGVTTTTMAPPLFAPAPSTPGGG